MPAYILTMNRATSYRVQAESAADVIDAYMDDPDAHEEIDQQTTSHHVTRDEEPDPADEPDQESAR